MQFFHFGTRNRKKGLLVKFLDSVNQTVLYLSRRTFSGNRSILKQNLKNQVPFGNRTKRYGNLLNFFSGNSKFAFYKCKETFPQRTFTIEEIIKTLFFLTSVPDTEKFCIKIFCWNLVKIDLCIFSWSSPKGNFSKKIPFWTENGHNLCFWRNFWKRSAYGFLRPDELFQKTENFWKVYILSKSFWN